MARSFNGSSDHLTASSAVVTAAPLTIAAWFYATAMGNQDVASIGDTAGDGNYFRLNLRSVGGIEAWANSAKAITSSNWAQNVWSHACGVFTTSTSRAAFLNGASKGTDTTSATPAGLDSTSIGRLVRLNPTVFFSGRIAEVGVWNAALSDDEVASLAKGYSPALIRPMSLVAYWPLIGHTSPEQDVRGGTHLTVTGATAAAHCPIIYPSKPPCRRW